MTTKPNIWQRIDAALSSKASLVAYNNSLRRQIEEQAAEIDELRNDDNDAADSEREQRYEAERRAMAAEAEVVQLKAEREILIGASARVAAAIINAARDQAGR